MNRRNFVNVGVMGSMFGLSLNQFLAAADTSTQPVFADSLIHIYLPGGFAHQETFDPKPYSPSEFRGPLGSIPTNVDGIILSENLRETAKIADKLTIIRSMNHGEAAHERGTASMFTGYKPSPALIYPSIGSVVSNKLGTKNNLPAYVSVPNVANESAGTGYLPNKYGTFSLGSDPADANFKVRDLTLPDGITDTRFSRRKSLLEVVDSKFTSMESSLDVAAMDKFYGDAYDMISSPKARAAFSISDESDAVRDAYGRNQAGQRMLMARRLVESGVRLVTLTYGGWDHHANIGTAITGQLPAFDKAYATLISDLSDRGMLDRTLVMVSSEFGRTPKINATAGRDHWPRVFSVVLSGGGIKGGLAYGTSDSQAAEPDSNPVSVENMMYTVYNRLGINGGESLIAPGPRPIEIIKDGKLIDDICV